MIDTSTNSSFSVQKCSENFYEQLWYRFNKTNKQKDSTSAKQPDGFLNRLTNIIFSELPLVNCRFNLNPGSKLKIGLQGQ